MKKDTLKLNGHIWYNGKMRMTYFEVEGYIKLLNEDYAGGYNDWRLPSLVDVQPLITPQKAFIETQKKIDYKRIWLNDKYNSDHSWHVDFYSGFCGVSAPSSTHFVCAIRD